MGAKRQYTAIFAIGAKLLGSFRGAINAAQSRLKGLEKTALSAGKSVLKFGALFSSVFAGIAALGVGAIFKKIFEGADEAATAFENRTRRLTASLMNQNRIGKEGWAFAEAQTAELYKHNEALSKQIGLSKAVLDQMAVGLAVSKFGPQRIAATVGPMANMLLVAKGFGATTEEAGQFAKAFGKAVNTGMIKPLLDFGIVLTDDQQKAFKKAETPIQRYMTLMKIAGGKGFREAAQREMNKPAARIQRFYNELEEMQIRVGEAAKPAKAAVADTWRSLLPELEPMLLGLQNMGTRAMMRFAVFTKNILLPAFKTLGAWWAGEGGKAFSDMLSSIGKAFGSLFKGAGDARKSMAQIVQERLIQFLKFLTAAFNWIGKNAKWLVPTVLTLVGAFAGLIIALEVAAAIAAIANPVSLIIIGLGLLVAAIAVVIANWNTLKEMFPKTTAVVEHMVEGFKLSFKLGFDFIKAIWKTLVALFTGDFTGVGAAWKKVWEDTKKMAEWWKTSLVEIAKVVGKAFKDYFLSVFEDIKNIWTWMKGFSWEGIKKSFSVGGSPAAAAAAASEQAEGSRNDAARNAAIAAQWKAAGGGGGGAAAATAPGTVGPMAAGYAGMGAGAGGGIPVTVASYGGPTEPGQTVGAYNNRLGPGDVAISPNLYGALGVPGPANYVMLDGQRYHVADSSFYTPGNPTSNMVEIWGYGNQIKRAGTVAKAYQHGGIVGSLTHAMLGERGPEAVIPLSGGGRRSRGLLATASRALGMSSGSTSTSVSFAPNITIHGGAGAKEVELLDDKLRDLARDFVAQFTRAQQHERRLSYEGGYG